MCAHTSTMHMRAQLAHRWSREAGVRRVPNMHVIMARGASKWHSLPLHRVPGYAHGSEVDPRRPRAGAYYYSTTKL